MRHIALAVAVSILSISLVGVPHAVSAQQGNHRVISRQKSKSPNQIKIDIATWGFGLIRNDVTGAIKGMCQDFKSCRFKADIPTLGTVNGAGTPYDFWMVWHCSAGGGTGPQGQHYAYGELVGLYCGS